MIPLREVSLDKVRPWKPLFKATQHRSIASHLMLEKKAKDHKTAYEQLSSMPMVKVGYEVYADGLTRVIRICEVSKSHKGDSVFRSRSKVHFRITHLGIQILEKVKQVSWSSISLSFAPSYLYYVAIPALVFVDLLCLIYLILCSNVYAEYRGENCPVIFSDPSGKAR